MRRQCGFLSTDNLEDFFVYDDLTIPFLAELGWEVRELSWKDTSIDYDRFDLIVVRSTWDYQQDADAFLNCLEKIDASGAHLQNSLSLMRWNLSKTYLRALESRGIPILPSVWLDNYNHQAIIESFGHFDCDEIVIKPLISANADDTFRITRNSLNSLVPELSEIFKYRQHLIQPFESSIVDEGEYSLFYFDGQFSHAILKTPKKGDFRVQEEHGGELTSVNPEKDMLTLAEETIAALPEKALYARVDFVRHKGALALMEIELIEPSLYFNMDAKSPKRFAEALDNYYKRVAKK